MHFFKSVFLKRILLKSVFLTRIFLKSVFLKSAFLKNVFINVFFKKKRKVFLSRTTAEVHSKLSKSTAVVDFASSSSSIKEKVSSNLLPLSPSQLCISQKYIFFQKCISHQKCISQKYIFFKSVFLIKSVFLKSIFFQNCISQSIKEKVGSNLLPPSQLSRQNFTFLNLKFYFSQFKFKEKMRSNLLPLPLSHCPDTILLFSICNDIGNHIQLNLRIRKNKQYHQHLHPHLNHLNLKKSLDP